MRTAGLAVTIWALICCLGGLSACSEAYFDPASDNGSGATDDVQLTDACENDGVRRSCSCPDGSRGIQDCLAGSWAECDCDEPLDIECTPGNEPACTCADGSESVRHCVNGALTDCICEGSATACTVCHAYPPADPHPASTDCSSCHPSLNEDDLTFADDSTHMDGSKDVSCTACHADAGTTTPMNHNIDGDAATVSANCQVCHDLSQHQSGSVRFNDPDPGDAIDPTSGGAGAAKLLCQTCHDGGSGTFFGGASPRDMSGLWTAPGAHANLACSACHGYHGGTPGKQLVADAEESGCANCHPSTVTEMSPGGSNTRHAVVDAEQSAGANLECVTCHEPHTVSNSPWRPITDPDDGSLVSAANVPSGTANGAGSDTNTFCLDCHDGSWTAAINISAELNNSDTVNSSFGEWSGGTWDKNLHREHVNGEGFACTECHNTHSNTGTAGTNRGRLLYSYIRVNGFPYSGKSSCSIQAGAPSGCHH